MITTGGPDRAQRRPVIVGKGVAKSAWLATGPAPFLPQSPGCDRVPADSPVFSATQDVHDGDVRGGHVDSGIPGIWRPVGGHGGADLVMVSRRGEQLAAVSVAGVLRAWRCPGPAAGDQLAGAGMRKRARPSRPTSGQVISGPCPKLRLAQSTAAATAFSASPSGEPAGPDGGPRG